MTSIGPRWSKAVLVAFLICGWTASAGAESAATRTVAVEVGVAGAPATRIEGRLEAQSEGADGTILSWPIAVPGRLAIEFPEDRRWSLTAWVEGFWFPHVEIPPGPGAGSEVLIEGLPASLLTARVRTSDRSAKPPVALVVELRPAGSRAVPGAEEVHRANCPLVEDLVRCTVPAGRFDLRITAADFVPVYRWALHLPSDGGHEAELIELRRGASLAGWIDLTHAARGQRIEVTAIPQLAAGAVVPRPSRDDGAKSPLEADVAPDGFFHLAGLEAGSYQIVVAQPGVLEARFGPVRLAADEEVVLERPIPLAPPARLSVAIDPPRPPAAEAWRLRLISADERGGSTDVLIAEGVTDEDGTWEREGLVAGAYRVTVDAGRGELGVAEETEIEAGEEHRLSITIPLVEVEGSVRIGNDPLAARIHMRRPRDGGRATFESDEEGRFEGWLAREGRWRVEVVPLGESAGGEIEWPEEVEVRARSGQRRARIDLELPDTKVEGRVVDSAREPVPTARVTARTPGGQRQASRDVDDQGRFVLRGLPEGSVLIGAEAEEGLATPASLDLVEGVTPPDLELVLEERVEITGIVTLDGMPLPGAHLRFRAAGTIGLHRAYGEQAVTDAAGRYRLSFVKGPLDVLVTPPTGPMALRGVPEEVASQGSVDLELLPGTGFIDFDGEAAPDPQVVAQGRLELFHAGGSAPIQELLSRGSPQLVPPATVRLPAMEPGPYVFCQAWPGQQPSCVERHLQSGGGVEFVIEPPSSLR